MALQSGELLENILYHIKKNHSSLFHNYVKLQHFLHLTECENAPKIDFFVKMKDELEIPILLKVESNDLKKSKTYQIFRLESNQWELSTIDDISNFDSFILMVKIDQYYVIIKIFTKEDISDNRVFNLLLNRELVFLIEIGIYLFMSYPQSPKYKFICSKFYFNFIERSYEKCLFKVLHENGRKHAIAFLLQNEYQVSSFEIKRHIPLVQKQLKSNEEFHKYIKDGNLEAIDKFLEANPNKQYIFNEDNYSACWVAYKMKNSELFSILCRRGLTFTDSEIQYSLPFIGNFFETKTFTGLDLNNIGQILESKTFTINKKATDLSVNDIYKELRKIPSMNLILNILNKLQYFFVYIDYQENISRFNPDRVYPEDFYSSMVVRSFISCGGGTKQLLGSVALSLTHFAIRLLGNIKDPYRNYQEFHIGDFFKSYQNRFNEIEQNIRKKVSNGSINDVIFKSVYDYPEKYWYSELISRVNYVFAFYGQDRGYQILQQLTPELLTFYETYVKPDFENYLRIHFNRNYNLFTTVWYKKMEWYDKYVHELNNLWMFTNVAYSKNVIIQSDCVALTCLKLYLNITKYNNSPLNLENTYFIELDTFSRNNYEVVSHLAQWELLILCDTIEKRLIHENISQYLNKVGKRFIFIVDMERSSPNICQDNVVTFTDSFKPTNIVRSSEKLIFDLFKINFQGNPIKLHKLFNFEEYLNISCKSMSIEILNDFFTKLETPQVGKDALNSRINYINRHLVTTIFELDELRDEIVEKYVCENITNELNESNFILKTKNNKIVTFPGKTLRIKSDYKAVNKPMEISSENSKTVYNDMDNDIFLLSLKNSSESFIIIDEEKEIQIDNFSYADMETFYENNSSFNIHWFLESDSSHHFFHHLKTFGSFDKTRSFCYRQKCTIHEEDLFLKLQNQKVFLITAPAGMGKTKTIGAMALNLVRNNSSVWAPVVLFRQCTEILKTFHPENSDPDYLIDFLAELLEYHDFAKEMFKFWCKEKPNKVCLFLDGADESGPEFTDITIKLIKRLSQTNIKHIIVSMREVGKFKFEYELDTIAIGMEPLSYDKKIECLSNAWPPKPNINNEIQIARKVAKHFRDFDDFLDNSLQIVLVAKICIDQLTKFEKNFINIYLYFKYELSLIEMYKQFIEKKFTKTFTDSDIDHVMISELLKKSEYQIRYAAIRVLLNDNEVKLFLTTEEIELHKNKIKVRENWEKFEGVVDGIYSEKLDFVHRTYAEYYFADFLLNHYKDWNENTEQFFFEHILVKKELEYVRKFLNSYKETSDLLSRKPTYFQIPATLHDAVVQNIERNNTKILQYLYNLGFNITINPFPLITKYINDYSPNSIEKLVETIKYLVTNCGNVHLSINELRQNNKILNRILLQDRIELIKAFFQCKLIDLDDDGLSQDQAKSFLSRWKEAKTKFVEDPEDKDSKKLLQIFDDILQMINING